MSTRDSSDQDGDNRESKAAKLRGLFAEFDKVQKDQKSESEFKLNDSKEKLMIELRDACESEHGLVVDDVRRRAWPLFLEVEEGIINPSWKCEEKYRDYRQVVVDVERSLNAYDYTDALAPEDK